MKKQVKKMVLAKETVRDLDKVTLSKVAGATDGFWSCRVCNEEPISYSCNC